MNADVINYIGNLEEHIETADAFLDMLEKKTFKFPKDRNAIKYWKAYKAGISRAIYLAEIHLEVEG